MRGHSLTQSAIVLLGAVAIALSVSLDDHEALSVMFGFTGMATAVFGLVLPQLDDEFEISPKGLKGKLRRARSVLSDDALTLEEKGDSLGQLLLPESESTSRDTDQGIVAIPPFQWPKSPMPDKISLVHVGRDFESHVRRAFEADGWRVTTNGQHEFPDFIAERDGDTYGIEVKAARHLSAADIDRIRGRIARGDPNLHKWVLVVPARALSPAAWRLLLDTAELDVLSVPISNPHVGDG